MKTTVKCSWKIKNFYYPFTLGRCFIRRCCSLKCVKETVSSCTQTPTESGGGASHVCHWLADVPVQPPSSFQHLAQSLGSLFLLWFVISYIFARFKGALSNCWFGCGIIHYTDTYCLKWQITQKCSDTGCHCCNICPFLQKYLLPTIIILQQKLLDNWRFAVIMWVVLKSF